MYKLPVTLRIIIRIAFAFSAIFLLAAVTRAATFTVTKAADLFDGVCDADCSLREAITAANNAASDDVIEFDPAVFATPQTIVLSGGDTFTIANSGTLTINGTSATGLTLSGNNSKRIFYFMPQANVTLRRMTITNGGGQTSVIFACGGGAILVNNATSVLEDVIVSNSRVFSQDPGPVCGGGGINNYGNMTIRRSRIEGNTNDVLRNEAIGGGISNIGQSTLTISESSITGNYVSGFGGTSGGGVFNSFPATLNLINSTVSGNSTRLEGGNGYGSGGGIGNSSILNVTHSTIVNNSAFFGGGVLSSGREGSTFNSRNSIYANNFSTDSLDIAGSLTSGGYNLIKKPFIITGDTTGNILNQDPLLQPLASAGIGITLAHKPFPTSPVIDQGKTFGIFADQRSVNRPLDLGGYPNGNRGDGADIGAIEMQLTDFSKGALFDFDGDRKTDVGILRSGLDWWINRSSDGQTSVTRFGENYDRAVPADYTGDGKADLAVFRRIGSTWYILRSENSTFYAFPFGIDGDVPLAGDFDGDRVYDQAVFRPANGLWYVKRSSDGEVSTFQFGIQGDQPVPADYDGDGRDDLAIYRPSTAEWWIARSAAGIIAVQFGQNGDKTVTGDYTGDGKADIAFFRPSTGFWYILRSEDSSYYGFPFGLSGDLPIPGDYDGDGKNDAAVFRMSNNGWYMNRSTAGTMSLQYGFSGDYPLPNLYVRQ